VSKFLASSLGGRQIHATLGFTIDDCHNLKFDLLTRVEWQSVSGGGANGIFGSICSGDSNSDLAKGSVLTWGE